MKVAISEEQLKRVKENLTIQEQDYLDQILKGGEDLINKGIDKAKELIPGTDVVKKSTDDPKKADLVGNDVDKFLNTLDNINTTVNQQARGTMRFQQDVESVQIALSLLGYSLPKYGVDGLFGPETAAAVNKYKKDKQIVESFEQTKKEFLEELEMVRLGDTNFLMLITIMIQQRTIMLTKHWLLTFKKQQNLLGLKLLLQLLNQDMVN